ncbi:response regulator [Desulfosporosinus youngiae]|uniref:Stage 0 sporulation protein A homolog n=1 Tax=Desulfosporosinus youngiae DSM 17734 TaxID=768710 RepID=H5XV75_9FIRM|nr:response regulator [Desulfosporosinus youngiae]EHQ89673.1 response regulator with CheY-like receiver domain and winged-helix DNA-binding domain [Desulfosporosinus youngiae DSM 17734]
MNKILIVDDELNNRLLLQEMLEDFEEDGTQLLFAADGAEALAIIQSEMPALVFLDIMLPEMDGFEVCHTVKSKLGLQNIFFAMLTAKSQAADRRKALDVKADMYITKPFKPKVIIDVVNKVFRA